MSWNLFKRNQHVHTQTISLETMRSSAEETRDLRGKLAEKLLELEREKRNLVMGVIDETLDRMID